MAYNKFGNRKVKADGYTFDSELEYTRYNQLKIMLLAGEITGLIVHPAYMILPGYIRQNGKPVRAVYYKADFEYYDYFGNRIVEDVKGVETSLFKLKRKMFEQREGIDLAILTKKDI